MERLFDALNQEHFAGALTLPQFGVLDVMDKATGFYTHFSGRSLLGLTDETLAMGGQYVVDAMLHEMVHHAVATIDGERFGAHGPLFTDRVNAIGAKLGLPPVEPESVAAKCWPQTLRNIRWGTEGFKPMP